MAIADFRAPYMHLLPTAWLECARWFWVEKMLADSGAAFSKESVRPSRSGACCVVGSAGYGEGSSLWLVSVRQVSQALHKAAVQTHPN